MAWMFLPWLTACTAQQEQSAVYTNRGFRSCLSWEPALRKPVNYLRV